MKKKKVAKSRTAEYRRKAYKKLIHKKGGNLVQGFKSVTRMVRLNVDFADKLSARAKKDGESIVEYTSKLARRWK